MFQLVQQCVLDLVALWLSTVHTAAIMVSVMETLGIVFVTLVGQVGIV